ncbi:hypothetical protein Acsp06_62650 [Actinomycetospora sp. NBRC 106375]|nr:hypothetical protein Acsp06_62650 [Actinomycetospora sp. NBRC 106375]
MQGDSRSLRDTVYSGEHLAVQINKRCVPRADVEPLFLLRLALSDADVIGGPTSSALPKSGALRKGSGARSATKRFQSR